MKRKNYVKKVKGGWKAFSESGRPLSRKPKTKKGAEKQLRAVHASQARRARRNPLDVDEIADDWEDDYSGEQFAGGVLYKRRSRRRKTDVSRRRNATSPPRQPRGRRARGERLDVSRRSPSRRKSGDAMAIQRRRRNVGPVELAMLQGAAGGLAFLAGSKFLDRKRRKNASRRCYAKVGGCGQRINPLTKYEWRYVVNTAHEHIRKGMKLLHRDPHAAEEECYTALGLLKTANMQKDPTRKRLVMKMRELARDVIGEADRLQGR